MDTTFSELSSDLVAHMDKQRSYVARVVATCFPGERLTRTTSDLVLLQKIIDAEIIPTSATWELQSLGIVFGDVLAATIEGINWWEVTDDYGTDPTLRYRETSMHINALTMLSKRIEDRAPVDVEDIAGWVQDLVAQKGEEVD